MGRRSIHTPEELRELIIGAATGILHEQGIGGLSAREVARRVSYSPGTIYNVFNNLDDLVLTIESRMLDRLGERLDAVPAADAAEEKLLGLAEAYAAFTRDNPRLWNLLFEHHLPAGTPLPDWYRQKLDGLMTRLEHVLAPLVPSGDEEAIKRSARVLWAGIHGLTSLSTSEKLSNITTESAQPMVRDFVETYVAGLKARAVMAKPLGEHNSDVRRTGV